MDISGVILKLHKTKMLWVIWPIFTAQEFLDLGLLILNNNAIEFWPGRFSILKADLVVDI